MKKAKDLIQKLKAGRDTDKAQILQRFFKTGKGEYGEGDILWGLRVPFIRRACSDFKDLDYKEIAELLSNNVHEVRFSGLVILTKRARKEPETAAKFYLRHRRGINNWDLVDVSAPNVLGPYFWRREEEEHLKMAEARSLWERRMAILATFYFIRQGNTERIFKLAEILLRDPHDLIHKAVGWMLREAGKKDRKALDVFLQKHAVLMPRTMLRYAIELYPKAQKNGYLKMKKSAF